jgi:acyl carrier protein
MNTLERLQDILVKDYGISRQALTPDAVPATLGIDSLGMLELMFKIEDHFQVKIPGDPPENLATIRDVVVYVDALMATDAMKRGSTRAMDTDP